MVTNTSSSTPPQGSNTCPTINIIGAGIAGLSLACQLRRRRVPFQIFDAASKPKGHNYGITISPRGYNGLLPGLEPTLDTKTFREQTAVDKLSGGRGKLHKSSNNTDDFRASDKSLRNLLATGHNIDWNHKVTSIESVAGGLKLVFSDNQISTANLTIDAGGERSGLSSLLLPDIDPEILSYAVYHGSRYIAASTFPSHNIFPSSSNTRSFTFTNPSQATAWHLEISKSHITPSDLPSSIALPISNGDHILELRYTFSRPSTSSTDKLFTPTRAKHEASQIPPAFYDEIDAAFSSPTCTLPRAVTALLDPASLRQDRVLNWLLRVKPLESGRLRDLAAKKVVVIGDAAHATPPLASEGAVVAMRDAERLADWIEGQWSGGGEVSMEEIMAFYEGGMPEWAEVGRAAKQRIREMHDGDGNSGQDIKKAGRI